jgi:polyferredoxin
MRRIIQIIATFFFNGYYIGFMKGKIYTGNLKMTCVPVMNCYSCPGAKGSCPIGSLQAVLGTPDTKFSFYVLGSIMLFGIIFGRVICGFFCPFGLLQDLLYKIPLKKIKLIKGDKYLRWFKYGLLLFLVILAPIFITNKYGMGDPFYCKYFCPVGTLEGGIPLTLTNVSLRGALGWLFRYKILILIVTLYLSIKIYRPFCKYFCPLGSIYGLFNKFSFYQMKVDKDKCTRCNACIKACKMNIDVINNVNSSECIRCGECVKVCPQHAISSDLNFEWK